MSDYRPFTDTKRQAFQEWAEYTVLHSSEQTEKDQAWAYLRYEGSLQAKDEQIATLIAVCQKFFKCHYCGPDGDSDTYFNPEDLAEFNKAVEKADKEATS